ncbi:TolC family protein [Idiomarina sp. HP20-50]|uniref:TolC family protein n=1 Tax=Idiomarina sp. HP20-50 TaxID=3070813 RepID=UPI00294B7224|nr:TolC family protein [Idiomarina sp. HP20-50]MDV6315316.1 TolC family protein [Idiomarina sp. HP20-50]
MRRLSFVVALLGTLFMYPVSATTFDLTLSEALQRTLKSNPSLKKYEFQSQAAEALTLQAGVSPNPRVGLEVENIAGSGRSAGLDNAQMTLSFSQILELGNKRQRRIQAATVEEKARQAEYEYQRIDVLAQTTQYFYQALKLQQFVELSEQQLSRTESLLRTAREREEAGAVPKSEVTRIKLQLERQKASSAELMGKLAQARARLSAMWAGGTQFKSVSGDFHFPLQLPSQAQALNAVNRAPEYLRLLDSERLLQAKVKALEADSTSDLTLGVGVRYNNQFNETGFIVEASMPLQLQNPNMGFIKERRIRHQSNLLQQKLVRAQLRSLTLALVNALQTHQNYLHKVTNSLLPLAQQLVVQVNQGYVRGTNSLLQVLDAQSELAELEYQKISRQHAIYSDIVQLERLTGQAFLGEDL